VAGVLKLWFSCLPEPVIPPEMYDAFLRTQRHRSPEARVAGIHAVLRQCEHRVLQVLYPLMEVRIGALLWAGSPCICNLDCAGENLRFTTTSAAVSWCCQSPFVNSWMAGHTEWLICNLM
jgi:hypothetical protein